MPTPKQWIVKCVRKNNKEEKEKKNECSFILDLQKKQTRSGTKQPIINTAGGTRKFYEMKLLKTLKGAIILCCFSLLFILYLKNALNPHVVNDI